MQELKGYQKLKGYRRVKRITIQPYFDNHEKQNEIEQYSCFMHFYT